MAQEVQDQVQGAAAGARTDEARQAEPAGDDQPEGTRTPAGRRLAAPPQPTHEEVVARAELGRWIPRSVLPADRDQLLQAATDAGAPDDVLEELRALPAARRFGTVSQMWEVLGNQNEPHPQPRTDQHP